MRLHFYSIRCQTKSREEVRPKISFLGIEKEEAVETYHGFFFIGGILCTLLHHGALRDRTIYVARIFVQLHFREGYTLLGLLCPRAGAVAHRK